MTGVWRPRRADVAASYDRGVDAYAALWSPVIQPPAQSVVRALGLAPSSRVLDIGAGTGALVPSIRRAAPGVSVIGLDPSVAMLRAARNTTQLAGIQGDATALPFRDAAADAALLAFVLFHLSDPVLAMAEVARVLTSNGRVGTVTWIRDDTTKADEEWDATLREAGAPPIAPRRVDAGLDDPEGIDSLFTRSGLRVLRIWAVPLSKEWDRSSYWKLVTGAGVNKVRLQQLEPGERSDVLELASKRLDALPLDAFAWSGRVLCAVATKNPGSSLLF